MSYDSITRNYKSIPICRYQESPISAERLSKEPYMDTHKEMEIIHILEGSGYFRILNKQIPVKGGTILFVGPHSLHGIDTAPDVPIVYESLCFRTTLILDFALTDMLKSGRIMLNAIYADESDFYNEIISLYKDIDNDIKNENAYYNMYIQSKLNLLITSVMRHKHYVQSNEPNKNVVFCKKCIKYLEDHYTEDINSQTLAKEFHYTHSYFCRIFKHNFTVKFSEYLCLFRLERAKDILLEQKNMPISQVATSCGFASLQYFTTKFKRWHKMSPREFRNSNINKL